jgi:orotate phosphoribosyltransferase
MNRLANNQRAKKAVIDAGVVIQGHFIFADGDHALTKLEMDHLWDHPAELGVVLDHLGRATGLPEADLIIGVPRGGQSLAEAIAKRLDLPLARLERIPGGAKQDFGFMTEGDAELARQAQSIRIYEDVVTTLSSIAGVVRLLNPAHQQISSLAIWRRGQVKPQYRQGVTDYYLVEEPIISYRPTDCPVCWH